MKTDAIKECLVGLDQYAEEADEYEDWRSDEAREELAALTSRIAELESALAVALGAIKAEAEKKARG